MGTKPLHLQISRYTPKSGGKWGKVGVKWGSVGRDTNEREARRRSMLTEDERTFDGYDADAEVSCCRC